MEYVYNTSGTCSKQIRFSIENGIISNVSFYGGCHGNLQGIAKLVEGMKTDEVECRLRGISCGRKSTSCPDQLAAAIRHVLDKKD